MNSSATMAVLNLCAALLGGLRAAGKLVWPVGGLRLCSELTLLCSDSSESKWQITGEHFAASCGGPSRHAGSAERRAFLATDLLSLFLWLLSPWYPRSRQARG